MDILIILASLIVFFTIIVVYSKNKDIKQGFQEEPLLKPLNEQNGDVYKLDTRYDFPNVPPVNPMVYRTEILNNVPADRGLYSNQEYIKEFILDENQELKTNQLNYSGGTTQIIKIPLQMNEPYNEQLRSQEVLITPYNRIKYSTTNC